MTSSTFSAAPATRRRGCERCGSTIVRDVDGAWIDESGAGGCGAGEHAPLPRRPAVSEAFFERLADRAVQRRLATDRADQHAADAQAQAAREQQNPRRRSGSPAEPLRGSLMTNSTLTTAPRNEELGRYRTRAGARKLIARRKGTETFLSDEPVTRGGVVYPVDVVPFGDGEDAVTAIASLYLEEARASRSIPMASTILDGDVLAAVAA